MLIFGHGPKEKWHADLEHMSRAALAELVLRLVGRVWFLGGDISATVMDEAIVEARKHGRWENQHQRHLRFMADPTAEVEKFVRRQRAAKKAARRRKKEQRRSKHEPEL